MGKHDDVDYEWSGFCIKLAGVELFMQRSEIGKAKAKNSSSSCLTVYVCERHALGLQTNRQTNTYANNTRFH